MITSNTRATLVMDSDTPILIQDDPETSAILPPRDLTLTPLTFVASKLMGLHVGLALSASTTAPAVRGDI